ncbi:MAG TPA: hypothetical protein VMY06_10495 [Sedimentisphaerales bacterium]|nr:hypothetical protein [Sedimentisphaerales bacterium]
MKRLLIVVCVAGFIAALPLSHSAMAKPKAKVAICHIIAANDVIPFSFQGPPTVLLYFGKEISVAPAAVPAHEAHGDSTTFFGGDVAAGPIAAFQEAGANLPAADCYVVVPLP